MGPSERVAGTWHIRYSTLPMWRSRRSATLNYLALPNGDLADVVAYLDRRGRERTIVGIDRPDGDGWIWRGVGTVTRFATSRWTFAAADFGAGWAVSHFQRTLFTPEGIDLCFRAEAPSADALAAAKTAAARHPRTRALAQRLFAVRA